MKRRLYRSLYALSLAAMLITAITVLCASYQFFSGRQKADLRSRCDYMAARLEEQQDFLNWAEPADPQLRITHIGGDGRVIFDSAIQPEELSNHLDRPEVDQALNTGEGQATRTGSLNSRDYYCARRLSDGSVLRLSRNVSGMLTALLGVLPLVVVLMILMAAICLYAAKVLTDRIVQPITAMAESLEGGTEIEEGYEELAPSLTKIIQRNQELKEQLHTQETERDTIDRMISNMQEGLILLGADRTILMANRGALDYFGVSGQDTVGLQITELCQDPGLLETLETASSGQSASGTILLGEEKPRTLLILASPVWNSLLDETTRPGITGVMLFLVEITEQARAMQARQEFASNVAHELKLPMESIRDLAALMMNGRIAADADRRKYSGMLHDEVERLLSMIEDILCLAQIEEDSDRTLVKLNLYTLARGVCASMREFAHKEGVSISFTGENAIVEGNVNLLHELISNLVENAIIYNREGGVVDVDVRENGDKVSLVVSDNGIGIPSDVQDRVFDRFFRVERENDSREGAGLGLSIVKRVAEYHRGELILDSEEGVGTTVTLHL